MKHLDLFSGIGGFALGLQWAGEFETIGFCEIDKYCQKVLKKRWPDVPVYEDVTTLDYEQFTGQVDIITGGFPCQDISLAGRGAGLSGERSGLYRYLMDAIRVVRPKYAILENVAALLSRGMGEVLGDLAEIGYDAEWHCIPASSIGAPHQRDRVWIIAHAVSRRGRTHAGAQPRTEKESKELFGKDWKTLSSNIEAICADVAHASGNGLEGDIYKRNRQAERIGILSRSTLTRGSGQAEVADTASQRRRQMEQSKQSGTGSKRAGREIEHGSFSRRGKWWEIEPDVGRVADGIPKRVDRLRGLGNAVVPQIVEILGKAITKCQS